MIIAITGLNDKHKLNIENLSALYFEEVTVDFTPKGEDITVHFTIEEADESVHVSALLEDKIKEYSSSFTLEFEQSEERFKTVKKAVNHVYVKLLTEKTGLQQPWGTLTGIRPTKLMHQLLRSGMTVDEVRTRLKTIYLMSDEKIYLLERIVERQLAVVPDLYQLDKEVSIYIGIPFCPTKCAYCTFPAYAINGRDGSVVAFLDGLHYEITETGKWLKEHGIKVTTVYFGGGTPTSISAEQMDHLYEKMYQSFPNMENIRELTVEAGRPDTITPEKIEVLKKWKVGRISINPQSFENETLQAIGRHHSVEETIEKYKLSRALGLENINMDLIIGLPGEGVPEMQHTLDETEKLLPESLTVHTLSFKRASTMTKNKEKYKVADRNEISEMMKLTYEWTNNHGYEPYYLYRQKNILGNLENVGYAMPSKESIYNIMIMEECQTIIGLGCGAASKLVQPATGKITRFANPKDPHSYNERFKHYTHEKLLKLNELFHLQ
ncbi:coproporphyrinogen III oxidase [Bacillus alkalicellulosilyticus]|uniref:coproporphyrinogen III oxidase n=1 Tax=Alkalihalobacterium alkalicellulosilyticum TaxID=1912214 RepID=UPI0009982643|nr:coproporphyrinogen III oxidase [Bacillus alkalicellulosilyticus]